MTVEARHLRQAEAILDRIAVARGEGADPSETLRLWRREEGLADGALEEMSAQSARNTIAEIEAVIEEGGQISFIDIEVFLRREYEYGWQLGWVCHARRDSRSDEDTVRDAAEQAEREVAGG